MKSRSDNLPPGLSLAEDDKPKDTTGMSRTAKKNLRKKEKRMEAAAAAAAGGDAVKAVTDSMKTASISASGKQHKDKDKSKGSGATQPQSSKEKFNEPWVSAAAQSETTEPAKKLKGLKKKLRQIEDLEGKLKSGEIKNIEKEQREKIARKEEIIKEIKDLEKELP